MFYVKSLFWVGSKTTISPSAFLDNLHVTFWVPLMHDTHIRWILSGVLSNFLIQDNSNYTKVCSLEWLRKYSKAWLQMVPANFMYF